MRQNSTEWNVENYVEAIHLHPVSAQALGPFQQVELQKLVAYQTWHYLSFHFGAFEFLDHSLAVKMITYVPTHTATDEPKQLTLLTMNWLRWLVEKRGFKSDIRSWKDWDRVGKEVDALQNSHHDPGCELAWFLLEDGFKPSELDSEEAFNYLLRRGYDESYIDEFLHPAPPVFWQGSVYLSWLENVI